MTNSHNTTRLDVDGMKALLMKLRFMQAIALKSFDELWRSERAAEVRTLVSTCPKNWVVSHIDIQR